MLARPVQRSKIAAAAPRHVSISEKPEDAIVPPPLPGSLDLPVPPPLPDPYAALPSEAAVADASNADANELPVAARWLKPRRATWRARVASFAYGSATFAIVVAVVTIAAIAFLGVERVAGLALEINDLLGDVGVWLRSHARS